MLPKFILKNSVFSLARIMAKMITNKSPSYCTKLTKQAQKRENSEGMQEESRENMCMFTYICVCECACMTAD